MPEFTGERLVPGEVEADLWNEHLARYLFARRLARHRRVLDIGSGFGYGAAELAKVARHVTACDLSVDTARTAALRYSVPNLAFAAARAERLPFAAECFNLITCFEVIEHLEDWPALLREAARLLAPGGQFIVSTPNRLYYEQARGDAGPNPFHVHEFDFEEFREALSGAFPAVRLYIQNHVEALCFEPVAERSAMAEVALETAAQDPVHAHFYLAVCAKSPQTGGPAFVYVPSASNVLREREEHIAKLEREMKLKDDWRTELEERHSRLNQLHTEQTAELRQISEWASNLQRDLEKAQAHIVELNGYCAQLETSIAALQSGVEELRQDNSRLNEEVNARTQELARAVELLHQTEATVEERTNWALSLDARLHELEAAIRAASASRWVRLGRKIGLGPELPAN